MPQDGKPSPGDYVRDDPLKRKGPPPHITPVKVTPPAKSTTADVPSAYQMLQDAVKVLPAMKYAQGVLGVICVVVIIGLFKLNLFFAALGVLILLGLMFGLLLFAIAAKQPHSVFKVPAILMIWAFVLTVLGMLGLAVSCIFWKKPIDYPSLVAQFSTNPTANYEKEIGELQKRAAEVEGGYKSQIAELKEEVSVLNNDKNAITKQLRISQMESHDREQDVNTLKAELNNTLAFIGDISAIDDAVVKDLSDPSSSFALRFPTLNKDLLRLKTCIEDAKHYVPQVKSSNAN